MKKKSLRIKEIADTSKSSWINQASYFSSDGITGIFICSTSTGKEYIHKEVPLDIWKNFKNSTSKGNSYNKDIKNKFQLMRLY